MHKEGSAFAVALFGKFVGAVMAELFAGVGFGRAARYGRQDYRHTPYYRDIYKMRSQTIERVFADAKEKHALRYTQLRGLQKVKMQVALTFACMNLKKLATWKRRKGLLHPLLQVFLHKTSTLLNRWNIFYKRISDLRASPNLSFVSK